MKVGIHSSSRWLALAGLALLLAAPARADVGLGKDEKLRVFGDFRFRLESDWDSQTPAGDERPDRNRARVRARLGFRYEPTAGINLALRVRTGKQASQQSPFITVLDSDNGSVAENDYFWDEWYLFLKKRGAWTTLGRDTFPFWKQNEMVLDDDFTLAGVSGGYRSERDANHVEITAGHFSLPDGMTRAIGNLAAAQLVYSRVEQRWGVTGALGSYLFLGSPNSINLINGNGGRDYALWVGSLQGRIFAGSWPVTIGLDVAHNAQDYSREDSDPFTVANRRHKDGYVRSASTGRMKERGDWLFAWYYARIETLAVHASYAQDDWVRWGGRHAGGQQRHEGVRAEGRLRAGEGAHPAGAPLRGRGDHERAGRKTRTPRSGVRVLVW
ncbi:MAG TPA: putative porin [Candidatus Polarisedimenticolia bacterium]|jgi:hypothetical protein